MRAFDLILDLALVAAMLWSVWSVRRDAQQRREYNAICEDVCADRWAEAAEKAREYNAKYVRRK